MAETNVFFVYKTTLHFIFLVNTTNFFCLAALIVDETIILPTTYFHELSKCSVLVLLYCFAILPRIHDRVPE